MSRDAFWSLAPNPSALLKWSTGKPMDQMLTVLIVEDDKHIADLIALVLEEAGYASRHVTTGTDTLAALRTEALDLVILDWMLPDVPGDQLCQQIKALQNQTFLPVLMLTARNTTADRVAGLEAGADDYLTKPFHTDELLARVRALLRIRTAELERLHTLTVLDEQHTRLKQMYDQLQSTQAQLMQTSKLAALGELVAGVAHELNNPLAVILGNAELITGSDSEGDQQAVAQIIGGAQRARRVVRSLMAFARQSQMEKDWYSPVELIEQVLDLRRASLRSENIDLDVDYAAHVPALWLDGPQIQQVLVNLLLNAEYALAKQPEAQILISVSVAAAPIDAPPVLPERPVFAPAPQGEQYVVIDVADNGPGIMPELAERVFMPFVTSKPVGKGTGLGLAISYGIVSQHDGTLQFASVPERGTTFRIALPTSRSDSETTTGDYETPADPSTGRVLIVDDEQDILEMVYRLLTRSGWDVTAHNSAEAALEALRSAPFDVILFDIKMPETDGVQFYERLQQMKLQPRPHLVAMTGDTSNPRTNVFLRQHHLAVLRKPFSGRELLSILVAEQEV